MHPITTYTERWHKTDDVGDGDGDDYKREGTFTNILKWRVVVAIRTAVMEMVVMVMVMVMVTVMVMVMVIIIVMTYNA